MFLAMGLVLADLHPAGAGDQLDRARPRSSRLTAGVMQAFDAVFANFGWQWLTPIVGDHAGRRLARRHAHLAGRARPRACC